MCRDYMAGRCHEGIDCKYAHPGGSHFSVNQSVPPVLIGNLSGDDEVDPLNPVHSYISPLSPVQEEPGYIPSHDLFLPQASPASSVLASPILSAPVVTARTSHFGEERRRRGRRAKKPLTIIPPPLPEEPELVAYSAHRVLDGSTLLELEVSPPLATALPDLSPDYLDVARTLVRPLSTPPSLRPKRSEIATVRHAAYSITNVLCSYFHPIAVRCGDALRTRIEQIQHVSFMHLPSLMCHPHRTMIHESWHYPIRLTTSPSFKFVLSSPPYPHFPSSACIALKPVNPPASVRLCPCNPYRLSLFGHRLLR